MGRIMAIDYGQKRTGLAVTDPMRIIATGLDTVPTAGLHEYIKEYVKREPVDIFVVGYPLYRDGTPSETAVKYVEPFINWLRKNFPEQTVSLHDERFTSKMAFAAMIDGGLGRKKRADKGTIDKVSATIILQDFLSEMHPV